MSVAQLSRFTDQELIQHLDSKMHHSPIILELVKRLQAAIDDSDTSGVNDKVECPVCMADLQADIDWNNSMFTVKIANT